MEDVFSEKLEDNINWKVLPLGISPPVNIASYLARNHRPSDEISSAILDELQSLKSDNAGTDGLMINYDIRMITVGNVADADAQVAVDSQNTGAIIAIKKTNPNLSHPLRQKEVIAKLKGKLHGRAFNTYTMQAIVWRYDIRDKDRYCWRDSAGTLTKYSHEFVKFIQDLREADVDTILSEYKEHQKEKRVSRNRSRK